MNYLVTYFTGFTVVVNAESIDEAYSAASDETDIPSSLIDTVEPN